MKTHDVPVHARISFGIRRILKRVLPAMPLALLVACQSEIVMPGTTDETNTARIVGPGGSSAPGAVVRFFDPHDTTRVPIHVDTSDADGRYSIEGLPEGIYNILASKGDLELFRDSVRIDVGFRRVDTLRHPGLLRGRVELEPGHDPLTAWVHAVGTDFYVNVGSDGSFIFPHIAGGRYTLRAVSTLPDYTPTFAAAAAVDDSAVALRDPIRLIYTGKAPRLVGPDGAPVAGAFVRAYKSGETPRVLVLTTVTDAGGRYDLSTLPGGIYNLIASHGGLVLFKDSIIPVLHTKQVDTLRRPGSLRGHVELQPWHARAAFSVQIPALDLVGDVDSTGGFHFPAIPEGDFELVVMAASHLAADYQRVSVLIRSESDSEVVLREAIRPAFHGIKPIQGLSLQYDTLGGVIHLNWRRDRDVKDYLVCVERNEYGRGHVCWTTSDTSRTDTVFHVGRGFSDSLGEDRYELRFFNGAVFRVCGRDADGRQGGCASESIRTVAPYAIARKPGVRWTKIGSPAGSAGSFGWGTQIRIVARGDSLWVFKEIGNGAQTRRVAAWKSGDGAHFQLVSDSLPIDVAWSGDVVSNNYLVANTMPEFWNDTLWALRDAGDTMRLVASEDGRDWREVPLPGAFRTRRQGTLGMKPGILATPAGLEIHFHGTSGEQPAEGIRRNLQGEWESGLAGLKGIGVMNGLEKPFATQTGVWSLFASFVGPSSGSYLEFLSGRMDPVRRPVPQMTSLQLAEVGGILYMPGSYPSLESVPGTEVKPAIFATAVAPGQGWWTLDLPTGVSSVASFSTWKGQLLLVDERCDLWLGEPAASP